MKAVELGQRIEDTRFLGREFMVYLWFVSEIGDGDVRLADGTTLSLSLDATLVLERKAEQLEVCRLRGLEPSGGREAKEALRDGKLPTRAHFVLTEGERMYAFHLNADTLATASVKIPELLSPHEEEHFFERMQLIEALEAHVEALFGEFLRLRISTSWEDILAPAMRRWVRDQETLTQGELTSLRERVLGVGRKRAGGR